ncbi:glycosyltransferase family 2 protein [Dyella nitratireducens]|uniref:Glycosyl transferase n=1 Tax=Dyella nitratireducens TaxID=1849580 RepID=A0ABQ1FPF6_9GAMM|nr:glycosyltransferase family 2 protein [Dyella nitratireducens]GGA23022.1 glycosyl transferase [Dyella nitratireducens]GLQ44033.1 glycosyl transferase [Dyella nitratireducens]
MPALDSSKLQLSVIIVSADSGPSLRDCVRSVLACTMPLEVLLIDNASSDSIPQAIARAHESDPRLKVIYNHANLGFGPAVNRAAAQAHGETLLILNPDCLIDQDALQRLLDVLANEKKVGLVGAVVCDAQGVPDPASFRRDPLIRRALATLFKRSGGVNAKEIPDQLVEAEAISGAVMLMPLRVFELLHGFDETYFLHCEDLDLCRRVRDAGWRVLLAGDVRVLHGKGGSSRHRPVFVSYHKHRGMWRWFRKFDPAARNPLTAAVVWLGIWCRFLLKIPGQWVRMVRR